MLEFRKFMEAQAQANDPHVADRNEAASRLKIAIQRSIHVSPSPQPPQVVPLKPQQMPNKMPSKPRGGLWYAPGKEWIDFLYYNMNKWTFGNFHELYPNYSTMLVLKTPADVQMFRSKYGTDEKWFDSIAADWAAIARDYSGMQIMDAAFERNLFDGWDVPSGVIWDPNGLKGSRLLFTYDPSQKKYVKQPKPASPPQFPG